MQWIGPVSRKIGLKTRRSSGSISPRSRPKLRIGMPPPQEPDGDRIIGSGDIELGLPADHHPRGNLVIISDKRAADECVGRSIDTRNAVVCFGKTYIGTVPSGLNANRRSAEILRGRLD